MKNNAIKSIIHNHYYYLFPYLEESFRSVAENRHIAFGYADVVLWLTNFSAAACRGRNNNVALMPNPVAMVRSKNPAPRKTKQLIAVGRFYDVQKRLDRILGVFSEIHALDSQATLVIVGGYSMTMVAPNGKTISEILAGYPGLENAITFAGETEDVQLYYEQASGLLMASDNEGFPLVLLEAGECGVPCFIYDTPCMEDIIEDGKNGFVCYEPNKKRLAKKIVSLMNDSLAWEQMSECAYNMAQRYSKEAIVSKWNDLFDILLEESSEPIEERISRSGLGISKTITTDSFAYGLLDALKAKSYIEAENGSKNEYDYSGLRREADFYHRLSDSILNSTSWRITRPLRWPRIAYRIFQQDGFSGLIRRVKERLTQ